MLAWSVHAGRDNSIASQRRWTGPWNEEQAREGTRSPPARSERTFCSFLPQPRRPTDLEYPRRRASRGIERHSNTVAIAVTNRPWTFTRPNGTRVAPARPGDRIKREVWLDSVSPPPARSNCSRKDINFRSTSGFVNCTEVISFRPKIRGSVIN